MTLKIDLNAIATILAYVSIVLLFVFWLSISRTMLGFLFVLAGSITLVVAVRSDHTPTHLVGILIAAAVIATLVIAGWIVIAARIARRCIQMPDLSRSTPIGKRMAMAERQAAEIIAAKPTRKLSNQARRAAK